jgi:MFS family permease
MARGILTGCIPIGAGFGALFDRKLIHLFSRRNSILVINTLAIVVGSLIFINKMEVLIIMRFFQGFCVGLYTSTIPMYIA